MNPEFLSGEASASPAVEPLLAGARRLAAAGFGAGALSARNGLRTTTHANLPLVMLTAQDFVEVADYDPHLDRTLCIGKREPHVHAGLHTLILRAKKEVGAIVMVELPQDAALDVPQVKRGHTQLENALAALEGLRGRDSIRLGPSLIVVGKSPDDALARAFALLGVA